MIINKLKEHRQTTKYIYPSNFLCFYPTNQRKIQKPQECKPTTFTLRGNSSSSYNLWKTDCNIHHSNLLSK